MSKQLVGAACLDGEVKSEILTRRAESVAKLNESC